MRNGRPARTLTVLVALGALTVTGAQAAPPEPEAPPSDAPAATSAGRSTLPPGTDEVVEAPAVEDLTTEIPVDERDATLGGDWETSTDQAWTLSGDPSGLHVLLADASDGYAWRTVATLAQAGVETDRWIGNACLTESGDRLVVAYAPRSFTNEPELFLQGAWTAVVDLTSGTVTDLPVRGSLEYFTPSCGHDEDAVLTVSGGEELDATRLVSVDAATATVEAPVEVAGQVTSAIATDAGLVAAVGTQVARIDGAGRVTPLTSAGSAPYEITSDSGGGVVFLEHDGTTATVRRLDATRLTRPRPERPATVLATGPLTDVGVTRTARGDVLLTGKARAARSLPSSVKVAPVAKDAEVSADGRVVVEVTSDRAPAASLEGTVDATAPLTTVQTRVTGLASGRTAVVDALVESAAPATDAETGTGPADRRDTSSSASRSAGRAAVDVGTAAVTATSPSAAHDPVDDDRGCSVPRNSVHNQAVQPKPRQVEWAVNQAVKGALTVQRPANWKNLAMPAYTPQGMFPSIPLEGGGEVPSQIMLGILAQESNLWQANGYVVPGVTGSPLIGNYYGVDRSGDPWDPNFIKADCGYGVAQVTDGMRRADTGMPGGRTLNQQRAIALDFAANVAAGMQILQEKWNQTRRAGLTINDGSSARIENWFFAVWAYNSGFYPEADKFTDGRNGAWGVGWANNPANPSYKPNRGFFHERPADATRPQEWPYPEKVIGFAAYPPALLESPETYVAAYRAAWWPGEGNAADRNRTDAKPPTLTFCINRTGCDPELGFNTDANGIAWGPCWHKNASGAYDGRCWYNGNATWKVDCQNTCGRSFIRFPLGYAYQEDGTAYAPACTDVGLPAGALVIDDVPKTDPVVRPGCARQSADAGTFTLTFSTGSDPDEYPSKMDLHQLGAGYGGHFWFGHTRQRDLRGGEMEFSGTWQLGSELHQWARVLVHIPDHGAHTRQATYVIDPGAGPRVARTILQRTMRNGWVSLGVFEISGKPSVTLSTVTDDGDYQVENGQTLPAKNEDIAFDAVAFAPLPAKPRDIVVALGDSFSSGEGSEIYDAETDFAPTNGRLRDGCHRSPVTWSRLATLPGSTAQVARRDLDWDPTLDYHLLACSGAFASHVLRNQNPTGLHGELRQLERNFLDDSTTLVTLSIGGNDALFMDTFLTCFQPGECHLRRESETAPTLDTVTRTRIQDEVGPRVETVLHEIHDAAPNARILLMGYPPLLNGRCGTLETLLSPDEAAWLDGLAPVLAARMAQATAQVNATEGTDVVTFVDPEPYFRGTGVCGSPSFINPPMVRTSVPSELIFSASQSLHPNLDGYGAYARAMTDALAALPR